MWLIFTELSILFSSTEVLSNFIAPGSPKNNGVEFNFKSHFHFMDKKGPIYTFVIYYM